MAPSSDRLEQRTHNPCVVSSILTGPTNSGTGRNIWKDVYDVHDFECVKTTSKYCWSGPWCCVSKNVLLFIINRISTHDRNR